MDMLRLRDPRGRDWTVQVPHTRFERMRGLLGREGLPPLGGMLLPGCRSIHTVRMRFGLDVVFLDATLTVIDVMPAHPGRIRVHRRGAAHVLEVAMGSGLTPGDVLRRR